jgi:S-adenosylmethionine hydrolase
MGIITLTTDFGDKDSYAGVMKGVIIGIYPQAVIVDITHQIDPQDLIQAAFSIRSSYRYFPRKTVHVVVVDPGVGTGRAVVAFEWAGHYFLGPDNGVLSLIKDEGPVKWMVAIDNPELFHHPVSDTFHGRDIFAPVAAHILRGLSPAQLGSPMDPADMVNLDYLPPQMTKNGEILGLIVDVDRFGNLITDIDMGRIETLKGGQSNHSILVTVGNQRIKGLSTTYQDRHPGDFVTYIGSRSFLEIALNQSNAADYLGIGKGESVKVSITD